MGDSSLYLAGDSSRSQFLVSRITWGEIRQGAQVQFRACARAMIATRNEMTAGAAHMCHAGRCSEYPSLICCA